MTGNNVTLRSFRLKNDFGDEILGDFRYVDGVAARPVIVICHSFMAFKDWGFFPYAASMLARAGFATVTFNFSLNGVAGKGKKITDVVRFERNTFSREVHDLKVVVDALRQQTIGAPFADPGNVIVLGHSRGGGIAIVFAARDRQVSAAVTWSSISTFDRWTDHQKEKLKAQGFLSLAKESSVSPLRIGAELLHDLETNRDALSILESASRLNIPWLILHGKADVIVQSREAESLYAAADKSRTELVLLDQLGHLYNAVSEEEDHYQTIDHVLDVTIHWLHKTFHSGELYA